jgi:hypothetical protein
MFHRLGIIDDANVSPYDNTDTVKVASAGASDLLAQRSELALGTLRLHLFGGGR